jgi:hypothetical protein
MRLGVCEMMVLYGCPQKIAGALPLHPLLILRLALLAGSLRSAPYVSPFEGLYRHTPIQTNTGQNLSKSTARDWPAKSQSRPKWPRVTALEGFSAESKIVSEPNGGWRPASIASGFGAAEIKNVFDGFDGFRSLLRRLRSPGTPPNSCPPKQLPCQTAAPKPVPHLSRPPTAQGTATVSLLARAISR